MLDQTKNKLIGLKIRPKIFPSDQFFITLHSEMFPSALFLDIAGEMIEIKLILASYQDPLRSNQMI
uniref:Uncharacterized protein n=1 Tax=Aegilops tauschii subsp. strangulata TaxID=200361 RepID=A0A453M4X6_AEGTS